MGRDTIQLETAVSTISQEYLLEFTSEYGITEDLHPELPGPGDRIVDFPEGKVGVYTKFFEFANFRIPISQFLFDILGHYQIHLSQLSVIGAAKVSHFEINCRVLNIIPSLNLFRVFYVPSFNSGWMSFSKRPGKNTPQCYTKPLDSLKNWNNRFFWVDERVFPTVVDWRINAPRDEMPVEGSYSVEDVAILNTQRTPIQKQPEPLLCLIGLSRRYFLGDDVYPTFLYDDDRDMDLFNLISAPNPTKVKTGTRPRAAHEVPLLTSTASRVIDMEEPATATESSGTPSTIEKSPLDFDNENPSQQITESDGPEDQVQETVAPKILPPGNVSATGAAPEVSLEEEVVAMGPRLSKKRRKRGNDGADENAPPKMLRKDHATSRPTQSILGGKSLTSMGLEAGSTFSAPTPQETPADVSDPDPLSYAKPRSIPEWDIAQSSKGATVAGDPDSEKSSSFTSLVGSPGSIYQPGWGVTNNCRLETSDACQDVVDHIVPPGYFSELRHMPNDDFLSQYNINLARKVAMGSQLRLRVVDSEVQGLRNQTSNLKTFLEAEADMKKAAKAKNADLSKELESLRTQLSDLQVNNNQLSQQVSNLQAQVGCSGIDFDEELYPYMLTAIAGHRWVIGHGLRLEVMKCAESTEIRRAFANVVSAGLAKGMSEGLKYDIEHEKAGRDLADVEAYDPEANNKLVKALQDLKDLKYPMIDQLEKLKDAPMELIMASLHLESDTGEDAPQWIRDLRLSSSQLKIPIYPEVRAPEDPWAVKEEVPLEDAIAANISRAEKKKKCRVVCRTHGIVSAHHARSDDILVSVPTVAPQGLSILLMDAGTQTQRSEDEASPRLLRHERQSVDIFETVGAKVENLHKGQEPVPIFPEDGSAASLNPRLLKGDCKSEPPSDPKSN
ncbi:hypothetical protein Tco_0863990 [Tanacetum coccineum]